MVVDSDTDGMRLGASQVTPLGPDSGILVHFVTFVYVFFDAHRDGHGTLHKCVAPIVVALLCDGKDDNYKLVPLSCHTSLTEANHKCIISAQAPAARLVHENRHTFHTANLDP